MKTLMSVSALLLVVASLCAGCAAMDVKLTGHYHKDKFYFFPEGRDSKKEELFLQAMREGVEGVPPHKQDSRFSPEQNLAIEYDAMSFLVRTYGVGHKDYAIVLGKVGRWKEAAEALRTATATQLVSAGTWGNLGVAEHALGHYRESLVAFGRARAVDSTYFEQRQAQHTIWRASHEGRSVAP